MEIHGISNLRLLRGFTGHAFSKNTSRPKILRRLHQHPPQYPCTTSMTYNRPLLRLENNNGSGEDVIEEGDLYRYTRYRWMYNEERELSKRYLSFNLRALVDAAVQATHNRSKHCSKILKFREGLHNKVFLMTMDDGTEIVAKLPNPNAGPQHLMTASEVATREFLREVLKVPVPRIIGWSSDKDNPVGAEYVLEEKALGRPLGSLWQQMSTKSKLDIISQIVEVENRLASLTFSHHGCIYYKDTLRDATVASQPLITNPPIRSTIANRFTLGPLTTPELWDNEDRELKLDRGPWDSAFAYIEAVGINEIAWTRAFARPRKSPHSAVEDLEMPDSFISLLNQYVEIAPHLVPPASNADMHSPTLWHPDLHRDNVFVDPDTNKIAQIIDWQSAAVAPLFLQSGVPRMLRHSKPVDEDWAVPERPLGYDNLRTDEKLTVNTEIESLTYHKYYKYQSLKKNPRHWACLEHQHRLELRTAPIKLVTKAWKNDGVFYLREALMAFIGCWDELRGNGKCPISFSEDVCKVHERQEANISAVGEILRIFRDENMLPVDGMVDPVDYERAKQNCSKFRDVFIGLATTSEEKRLHERLWPYQDTEV